MSDECSRFVRAASLRFLALGDSYTVGEGVTKSERWPDQLVVALLANGYAFEPPEVIARTGWTTGELAKAIQTARIDPPYDLVSLMIGVNNQYRGYSREEYRTEFADLLAQSISFAGGIAGRVLVQSIPDYSATPLAAQLNRGAISKEITAFNAINRLEAERRGVHYVDITPISIGAEDETDWIAGDGLHPSGKMYAGWVEMALPVVLQELSGQLNHSLEDA